MQQTGFIRLVLPLNIHIYSVGIDVLKYPYGGDSDNMANVYFSTIEVGTYSTREEMNTALSETDIASVLPSYEDIVNEYKETGEFNSMKYGMSPVYSSVKDEVLLLTSISNNSAIYEKTGLTGSTKLIDCLEKIDFGYALVVPGLSGYGEYSID